jgi:hypothetical protein
MEDPEVPKGLQPTRRTVLLGAALIPVASIRAAPQREATAASAAAPVLSVNERRTLSAFVDRLIPRDELGPSASECGVIEYIDDCLSDFLVAEKPAILQGLAAFEAFARASQGAVFSELPVEKQDAVLTAIDSNQAPALRPFFTRVRRLTLEGMFGDPSYGGNKNFAGWDLLRYPGAKLATSPEDQRMSTPATLYRKALYSSDKGAHAH